MEVKIQINHATLFLNNLDIKKTIINGSTTENIVADLKAKIPKSLKKIKNRVDRK